MSDVLDESLKVLCNSKFVDEVILINNNVKDTPDFYRTPKLIHHIPPQNVYVSDAWNYGVRSAKGNYICLLNDDVVLSESLLEYMASIEKPKGIIGLAPNSINSADKVSYSISETKEMTYAYACCLFFPKSSYKPIPIGIRIVYNDNYLFNKIQGPHYHLHCNVKGSVSTSINKMLNNWSIANIMDQDRRNFERILNDGRISVG